MTNDLLVQLKAIDPAIITEVARKASFDPDICVDDWMVEPLSGGGDGSGIFRLSGFCGDQSWAVVAKHFSHPAEENEFDHQNASWKKEIFLFESGVLEQLPSGIRAPRYYGSTKGTTGDWLWMENLIETGPKRWPLEVFQKTARKLGQFNASYLGTTPIPSLSWTRQNTLREFWADDSELSKLMLPTDENSVWNFPAVCKMFNDSHKERILRLVEEKKLFFQANDHLPQVFCHNDAQRRNFLWVQSSRTIESELAVIDWAFSSIGALGNDLGELVGNSMWFFEYSPYEAETLEAALLESYLAGIADQKIEVDPRLVRMGYLISTLVWMGMGIPLLIYFQLPPESNGIVPLFGHTPQELLPGWAQLSAFALDRADEARGLLRRLIL